MVNRTSGLLLIERFVVSRETSIGISAEEARQRYRGFDGIVWPGETVRSIPLEDGLAPLSELPRLLAYASDLDGVDLIYCAFEGPPDSHGFRFLGYDIGYFESEYNHFSTILNEIVFGEMDEMTRFGPVLNRSLLFDSSHDAERVVATRTRLLPSAHGALETGEERIEAVPIFDPHKRLTE